MRRVYLALGTNLGDRRANLVHAVRALCRVFDVTAVSSIYQSEPVGYADQPDFWNMAVQVETDLLPRAILEETQRIEKDAGRAPTFRNGPRVLDIDLVLCNDDVIDEPALQVPHPRMLERAFVLKPLIELDGGLRHPATGRLLADHLGDAKTFERSEPVVPAAQFWQDAHTPGSLEQS